MLDLRGLNFTEIESLVEDMSQPSYRAAQIFRWVHHSGISSIEEMSNLSKDLRSELAERSFLTTLNVDAVIASADGTRKLRLRCADDEYIESVIIPHEGRMTLCVSSQVGCALGCLFCATATLGLRRNLSAAEIVDQVYRARDLLNEGESITNLVFMGMGEPLANFPALSRAIENLEDQRGANFSSRRITVSTAGLVPGIRALGAKMPRIGLAISLHATTDTTRDSLVPINKRWPLADLMQELRHFPLPRRRRITIEYLVLPGINDSADDAQRLSRLLHRIPSKVNLLAYNPCRSDQPQLKRADNDMLEVFADRIRAHGLSTTVRQSRGIDIAAACGQLALN